MKKIIKQILKEEYNPESNYGKVIDHFKTLVPSEHSETIETLFNDIKDFVVEQGFTIKVLNSCSVPFMGVRTRDFIVICSPTSYRSLGDFIYTLFHEIRHEIQMGSMGLDNPLTGDVEDFEGLYVAYWDMELDAHNYGLGWVDKIKGSMGLPGNIYDISPQISHYPTMSHMVRNQMVGIHKMIVDLRNRGLDFSDITDLPMMQQYLDKLEDFF